MSDRDEFAKLLTQLYDFEDMTYSVILPESDGWLSIALDEKLPWIQLLLAVPGEPATQFINVSRRQTVEKLRDCCEAFLAALDSQP